MTGTLINAGAIIVGGTIGLLAHSKLPAKITKISFQAIGIFTMFVGIQMALKSNNYVLIVFSLLLGAIIGELFDFEQKLQRLSKKFTKKNSDSSEQFTQAVITTFILYCMGSMAILGAIEDGLGYKPNLLIAKSILDGFSSIALAAAFGPGVIVSVIPLILFQGGITLGASYITNVVGEPIILELSAVGGLLLIGLSLSILEIKKIHVTNMLPALIIVLVAGFIMTKYGIGM
ncbi:MAG: putative membrane protein YdfK [Bacteroidetes bacterium ADurb.Bin217]|nr:MAG: putative membrane protein YdfK [Bacteroidetes bacterium ADurb.Bin217]